MHCPTRSWMGGWRLLPSHADLCWPWPGRRHERAQLEVYTIWAVQQNELFTDDSFVLNKVRGRGVPTHACLCPMRACVVPGMVAVFVFQTQSSRAGSWSCLPCQAIARLKEAIAALPDACEEERAAAQRLLLPSGAHNPAAASQAPAPAPPPPQQAAEADPFGLDDFLAQQEVRRGGSRAATHARSSCRFIISSSKLASRQQRPPLPARRRRRRLRSRRPPLRTQPLTRAPAAGPVCRAWPPVAAPRRRQRLQRSAPPGMPPSCGS